MLQNGCFLQQMEIESQPEKPIHNSQRYEVSMFQPTHWLVSRSRKVPVVVQGRGEKSLVFTEGEWGKTDAPAFELHVRMGMYCKGVQVLGYSLEPMTVGATEAVEA
jgi:hypothetical protein